MARAPWVREAVYRAGERFVAEALRRDGSIFTPGRAVWRLEAIEDLDERLERGDPGGFFDRLDVQLADATPETRQLAAESLFLLFLAEDDHAAATKRDSIRRVLGPLEAGVPAELDEAYERGLAATGAGKSQRPVHLRFLLAFVRRWKSLPDSDRDALLADPRGFRHLVEDVKGDSTSIPAEALLHLVFPDRFESIVSITAKHQIARTFQALVDDPGADVDTQLEDIRRRLEPHVPGLTFYEPVVRTVWGAPESAGWREFLRWARRLYADADFDGEERDYKLVIAEHMGAARASLDGTDWLDELRRAFGPPNNLTTWREHQPLLQWAEHEPEAARALLRQIWFGEVIGALRGSLAAVPSGIVSGRAARTSLTSLLLFGVDEKRYPFFRQTVYETTCRLVGREVVAREASAGDLYADWISVLDELRVRLLAQDVETRDRLDAQSLAWWITSADPPQAWSEDDRRAFLAFREHGARPWSPERAWLVRGANAYGSNIVPVWLDEGFVSISNTDEPRFDPGITLDEMMRELRAYPPNEGRSDAEIRNGALSALRFVNEMEPGHLVATVDPDGRVFVGRLDRELEWRPEGAPGTSRRRATTWLNRSSPADRTDLSDAARRLFTPNTVVDLTAVVGELVALLDRRSDSDPTGEATVPPPTEALARELHVTRPWLQEIVDLLNEKRQVVFYGPPGTGKTFVAQALGRHVAGAGGTWRLVQFHPAYSYEDFFEGYRPTDAGDGGVRFALRHGPLREIADAAQAAPDVAHLLIVDEINRGNIAKIFGEMYFLLEYRDRAIRLQYSPEEEFSLPDNLFVIGTMNTADRSIALVDSALRRRFYFVGFIPTEPPLDAVLRKWLDANEYPDEAARFLTALNVALAEEGGADEEFAIGPSYFMTRAGPPDVDRIWKHAIAPLLEERFYGALRAREIADRFGPAALRGRRTAADDALDVVAEE